jgi:hypothetical protein
MVMTFDTPMPARLRACVQILVEPKPQTPVERDAKYRYGRGARGAA